MQNIACRKTQTRADQRAGNEKGGPQEKGQERQQDPEKSLRLHLQRVAHLQIDGFNSAATQAHGCKAHKDFKEVGT